MPERITSPSSSPLTPPALRQRRARYAMCALAPWFVIAMAGCAAPQKEPTSILGEPVRPAGRQTVIDPDIIGLWQLKRAELAGKPFQAPPDFELRIGEGRYGTGVAGSYHDRGRVELFGDELAGQPRRMDVVGEVGPNKGKRIPALYRMVGRDLEIVYDLAGLERPREFASREGTQLFRVTYQRKN